MAKKKNVSEQAAQNQELFEMFGALMTHYNVLYGRVNAVQQEKMYNEMMDSVHKTADKLEDIAGQPSDVAESIAAMTKH